MVFVITFYCLVLTTLNYSNLGCFLRTCSLKSFHKLRFMTLFILLILPTAMEITIKKVNRSTGNLSFVILIIRT